MLPLLVSLLLTACGPSDGAPDAYVLAEPTAAQTGPAPPELTRRMTDALARGHIPDAEATLAELERVNAPANVLRSSRKAIEDLRKRAGSVELFSQARWMQGRARTQGTQLVVFWELWCPHCRTHMPGFQAFADQLGASGLQVIGVTTLSQGTVEARAQRFLDDQRIRFPIAVVPPDVPTRAGVEGVPHAMLLQDGQVLWSGHPDQIRESQLRNALD